MSAVIHSGKTNYAMIIWKYKIVSAATTKDSTASFILGKVSIKQQNIGGQKFTNHQSSNLIVYSTLKRHSIRKEMATAYNLKRNIFLWHSLKNTLLTDVCPL